MKRSQIIAVVILVAAGGILAAAFLGLIAIPVELVYVGLAVLIVGLGVGQALKKSDLVYLVGVLVFAGIVLVLVYTNNVPFGVETTPELAYVGGAALATGIGTGRVL